MDLKEVFSYNFLIAVNFDTELAFRASEALLKAREKGFDFKIVDYFDYSAMDIKNDGNGYSNSAWKYIGILDGQTYITDEEADFGVTLSVTHFEKLVEEYQTAPQFETFAKVEKGLVISGGVVQILYKNGQEFHLFENGVATVDMDAKVVITEHTFLKDGQKAYERVIVEFKHLAAIYSDTLEVTFRKDGKLAFTQLYNI